MVGDSPELRGRWQPLIGLLVCVVVGLLPGSRALAAVSHAGSPTLPRSWSSSVELPGPGRPALGVGGLKLAPLVAANRVREITPGKHNPFPTEWPLIALEFGSAAVTGFVYAFLVDAILSAIIDGPDGGKVSTGRLVLSGVVTFSTGPPLVAAVVWAIGRFSQYYRGSFWWAVAGAYAGQLLASGLSLIVGLSSGTATSASQLMLLLSSLVLPALGSVLAHTLTRRALLGTRIGSLWNLHRGRWTAGIPLPTLVRSGRGEVVAGLTLVGGRF